jgi:hypothetical protein
VLDGEDGRREVEAEGCLLLVPFFCTSLLELEGRKASPF